jgi:ATP-dependent Clp protease ATP-binding subunit ClpA
MFDRFSDEGKEAFQIARRSAQESRAEALDDVHLLIGCCRAADSLAARVLRTCGVDVIDLCARVETGLASSGRTAPPTGQLPFTSRTKQALELALDEAADQGHTWIGTHHVLLGLIRCGGPAAELLRLGGSEPSELGRAAAELHRLEDPDERASRLSISFLPKHAIAMLRGARRVCIDLKELELASSLRNLIDRLEKGK